jgi:uncharacterized protein (DUF3820 family)
MLRNTTTDKELLIKLANYRMPFGKYADRLLRDIPEEYFLWFKQKGFPKGQLGEFMAMMLEMKTNGLERLLDPLIKRDVRGSGRPSGSGAVRARFPR